MQLVQDCPCGDLSGGAGPYAKAGEIARGYPGCGRSCYTFLVAGKCGGPKSLRNWLSIYTVISYIINPYDLPAFADSAL